MSQTSLFLCCLLVVGAGASVALQQVLNADLRVQLQSPWWAGFVSYAVGAVLMLIAGLCTSPPRIPEAVPGWSDCVPWIGGLFGAAFIATGIVMVPRLGATRVLGLIVVGQMVASLAMDHFGFFGLTQHPATPKRIFGASLLILGVFINRAS